MRCLHKTSGEHDSPDEYWVACGEHLRLSHSLLLLLLLEVRDLQLQVPIS